MYLCTQVVYLQCQIVSILHTYIQIRIRIPTYLHTPCIHTHNLTDTHAYIQHTHTYRHTHAHIYAYSHNYTTYTYIHTCLHTYIIQTDVDTFIYTCIQHIYTYKRTHKHTYMHTYILKSTLTTIHTNTNISIRTDIQATDIDAYIRHTYIHTHTYTHIHAYLHTDTTHPSIHTYIYTHIQAYKQTWKLTNTVTNEQAFSKHIQTHKRKTARAYNPVIFSIVRIRVSMCLLPVHPQIQTNIFKVKI